MDPETYAEFFDDENDGFDGLDLDSDDDEPDPVSAREADEDTDEFD